MHGNNGIRKTLAVVSDKVGGVLDVSATPALPTLQHTRSDCVLDALPSRRRNLLHQPVRRTVLWEHFVAGVHYGPGGIPEGDYARWFTALRFAKDIPELCDWLVTEGARAHAERLFT